MHSKHKAKHQKWTPNKVEMKSNSVSVLGAGSYGTALAFCLARNGNPTLLWGRDEKHIAEMEANRENARYLPGATFPDALVVNAKNQAYKLDTLPEGSVVGTSSLRRLAQLRHHYPHLIFKDVRGNVITRLEKLDSGDYDCLILAAAGLGRLGFSGRIHQLIPGEISLHAVGQGALGIECVEGNPEVLEAIKVLEHTPTSQRCLAERAFLRELEGGCQVPIGVNTRFEGDQLNLTGMVASLDGKRLIRDQASGAASDAEAIGIALANTLKGQGAGEILKEIFETVRPEA